MVILNKKIDIFLHIKIHKNVINYFMTFFILKFEFVKIYTILSM